jgi:hypothetical protein
MHLHRLWSFALLCCIAGLSTAAEKNDEHVLRIGFVGDVCLDGGPGHAVTAGQDPFAGIAAVLRDNDLAVANLECAVPVRGHGHEDPHGFTFRAPTEAVPLLKRYFAAVSLANNHAVDWGRDGLLSELELLEREKLPYFGAGRTRDDARRPLLLTSRGRRVALLGCCDFSPHRFAAGPHECGTAWLVEDDLVADVRAARSRDHADLVIPFLHWGTEHTPTPEDYQPKLARRLIEAGADAVIGSHPHVTQTVDWYRGKPIVYSLGNCVFNYFPYDPVVYFGWCVQLTFGRASGVELKTTVLKLDAAGLPQVATRMDRVHHAP